MRIASAFIVLFSLHCAESGPSGPYDGTPGDGDGRDGIVDAADGDTDADDATVRDDVGSTDDAGTDDGGGTCTTPDTVSAYYGNGAYAISGNWGSPRMAVHVTGCGGRPVANADVVWTVVEGVASLSPEASLGPSTTITVQSDAAGVARAALRMPSGMPNPLDSNNQGRVQISAGGSSIEYRVVVFNSCATSGCGSGVFPPLTRVVTPDSFDLGTHRVGDTITGGIVVAVANQTGWESGRAVPNVGIRLIEAEDMATEFLPAVMAECVGEAATALSDASGNATCDVRVLAAGTGVFRLIVGESVYWNIRMTVTP
jgi:hypothetical protein